MASKQRDLCLRTAHERCATFVAARELESAGAERGTDGLWPVTRATVLALEPARRGPVIAADRARAGGQALLVGLMIVAFAVLVIARTTPGSSGAGEASALPVVGGASPAASDRLAVGAPPTDDPPATLEPPSASPAPSPTASEPVTPSPKPSRTPKATAAPPGSLAPGSTTYTVKAGDTLSAIAARFGVTVKQLRKANDLAGTVIHRGQVLVIPGS